MWLSYTYVSTVHVSFFAMIQCSFITTIRSDMFGGGGGGGANNKGADQPAHPRRLISAFIILFAFLESTTSKFAYLLASLCR